MRMTSYSERKSHQRHTFLFWSSTSCWIYNSCLTPLPFIDTVDSTFAAYRYHRSTLLAPLDRMKHIALSVACQCMIFVKTHGYGFLSTSSRRRLSRTMPTIETYRPVQLASTREGDNEPTQMKRRATISSLLWAASSLPALAVSDATSVLSDFISTQTQAESSQMQIGLLESRVTENVLSPPSYGMEGPNVFYPP